MNLSPRTGIALGVAMVAALLGAVALAAVTRPIDRASLPRAPSEVRDALLATHTGGGQCVRWALPSQFSARQAERLAESLMAAGFHADLHSALPLMSGIRLANAKHASGRHTHSPAAEFENAALARLSRFEQFRVGRTKPDTLIPALEAFDAEDLRLSRDRARRDAFLSTLPVAHAANYHRLVQEWRSSVHDPSAQAAAVDMLAADISVRRLDALQALLATHYQKHGRFPANFKNLLVAAGNQAPEIVTRGIERDGSLRDGWLRSLEYFRAGHDSYRLRSQGSDATTDDDDILRSP